MEIEVYLKENDFSSFFRFSGHFFGNPQLSILFQRFATALGMNFI
jgi:hypothetical protein